MLKNTPWYVYYTKYNSLWLQSAWSLEQCFEGFADDADVEVSILNCHLWSMMYSGYVNLWNAVLLIFASAYSKREQSTREVQWTYPVFPYTKDIFPHNLSELSELHKSFIRIIGRVVPTYNKNFYKKMTVYYPHR